MSLVLSVFPGFGVGGAQARFCAVANHHGRALRHAVVALNGNTSCRERLVGHLDIQFVAAPAGGGLIDRTRRIRTILNKIRPDVMLTHNWGAIEWALANLRPLARHVHVEDGFGPEERDRQITRRIWTRRLALRRAQVVLPSQTLMRMAEQLWRLDKRRLRYVPNGVDLARFQGVAPCTSAPWTLPGEGPLIGTVAALRPEKNLARLLEAVAGVPALRLVVVGDGPERGALAARAERLGINDRIALVGHLDEPATAYRHMDVFALSSDTEQMPLTVLEAMAAGLPVAATDVGDVRAMLAPDNGAFVVTRDAAALGAALAALARDGARRREIGAANRRKAIRDFDQAAMFAAWGELLGAGGAPSA